LSELLEARRRLQGENQTDASRDNDHDADRVDSDPHHLGDESRSSESELTSNGGFPDPPDQLMKKPVEAANEFEDPENETTNPFEDACDQTMLTDGFGHIVV
jgi:hypothetical protein